VDKDLSKEETDSYCCKDKCHPEPDLAADRHFIFSFEIIMEDNSKKNNGYGSKNATHWLRRLRQYRLKCFLLSTERMFFRTLWNYSGDIQMETYP
jgi:hypothetical protein